MRFQVIRLLTPDEVRELATGLARQTFTDGKATAGLLGRDVKDNLQADRNSQDLRQFDTLLRAALDRSAEFQAFAIPRRVMAPTFSRYTPGMHYGTHMDSALMGADRIRTDLAMTVFLSPAEAYEGGELIIEMPMGEQEIKLDAGEAILYPANTLHRVAPVTKGERLVAVTWIQSCVPDERLREIVVDLGRALATAQGAGQRDLALLLSKSHNNLLRYAIQS